MSVTPREELAARLDSARRRKNLSIRAVARLVDVPAATVQGWLSGKHAPTPALRPQFERLVRALGLEGEVQPEWLDVDRALGTLRSGDTPYVGLRPYATTEERLFFGRDVEAARIATAVRHHAPTHGLVALVGPSGSGKSSLLAAGLVGRHCAPGGLLEHRRGRVLPVRDLTTHPDTGDADLIVLDQFEELLDLGADRDATLAAVVDLAARVTVVLGIRSDAYGRLAELGDLRDALERPILVQPMAPEEIRQAITGPAALRDVEVDPGLVELVLADTGAAEDPQATLTLLPLVSHALLMTWGAGSGQRMTVDDYRRAGGLSSAVENLADGIVASLSTEQRRTARALFMRMVGLLDDRAVRRPVALASLSTATLAVARPFVDARVLSTTETQLHISHDSVLRHAPVGRQRPLPRRPDPGRPAAHVRRPGPGRQHRPAQPARGRVPHGVPRPLHLPARPGAPHVGPAAARARAGVRPDRADPRPRPAGHRRVPADPAGATGRPVPPGRQPGQHAARP
ncbi:helix-turn-helix domain-containing protein [Propioniciclava sp. MC1683]|uniref:nSTAND1 domain-containing NTPase n=1 Tax=Propioniciclava sp. MC1683 TaxID=2760309 RepID=UPI001602F8D2|nr:helix-turn-helix domain-containing protein [Propioniciclava sp. MC1683]MBB1502304.1 helix-turn-helix domain-containing protein [Propioniciclava sp. MC1683]